MQTRTVLCWQAPVLRRCAVCDLTGCCLLQEAMRAAEAGQQQGPQPHKPAQAAELDPGALAAAEG